VTLLLFWAPQGCRLYCFLLQLLLACWMLLLLLLQLLLQCGALVLPLPLLQLLQQQVCC
jgi:hypothetical protein